MHIFAVFFVTVVMYGLWVIEGTMAYRSRMFFPSQLAQTDYRRYLPFIAHGGAMWGDPIIVNPLIFVIIWFYGGQWSILDVTYTSLIVWPINILLHKIWAQCRYPDCLAWGGELTPAGCHHFIYMGLAMTVLVQFYFDTKEIDPWFLWCTTAALTAHLFLGTHKVLDIINPAWWNRKFIGDIQGWLSLFIVLSALYWRTYTLIR